MCVYKIQEVFPINIRLYMAVKNTKALGPYNRYVIWVQGCLKNCKGCISEDSRPLDGGYEEDITALADDIINTPGIEGITVSGGEPFLQAGALAELIKRIKSQRDTGVIIYTGMNFEEIEESELAKISDLIIDGEYREELNDNLSLRGSSNQNIYLITERYKAEAETLYGVKGRKIELHVKKGITTMVGIPDKNSLKLFKGETNNE